MVLECGPVEGPSAQMNPDLEKLIHLQRTETELRKLEAEMAEIPGRTAAADEELEGDRQRLASTRETLDACQRDRRRHEGELQALETRRSKYKDQLMEVKTNKEYTAVLHEIEAVEREIREREDRILEEMERAETLASEVQQEEIRLQESERRHRSEVEALDRRAGVLKADCARVMAERDAVAAELPEEMLELFRRVARLRGAAVAEARDGTCQLCHVKLRLQMYADLKRNDAVVQCPSCSRILFYEPPPPETAPSQP